MIILGLDALDVNMVEKFACRELMQLEYGRTDISEFDLEKTVILWASFLTGTNMQNMIKGDLWSFRLEPEDTFFRFFKAYKTIDVPALSLKQSNHEKERKLLAGFFKDENSIEEYDSVIWKHHEENKVEFFNSIDEPCSIMVYFDLADAIGHLSFGDVEKMGLVYKELNEIAKEVRKSRDDITLIVSDHGMKAIGRFGDHTKTGFWSCNKKLRLKNPRITDFFKIVEEFGDKK